MNAKKLSEYVRILRSITQKSGGYRGPQEVQRAIWSVGDQLVTTNLEQWVFAKVGVRNLLPKPVECAKFYDALRTGGDDVKITAEDKGLSVDGENGRTLIRWMESFDGLQVPELKDEPGIKFRAVAEDIEYILPAISREIVRYTLTGIALDGTRKRMVCSDGKRLNTRPFASDKNFKTIIIPRKAGEVMRAILECGQKQTFLRIEGNPKCGKCSKEGCVHQKDLVPTVARLEFEDFAIVTRLLEGTFPDYKGVFPEMYHWTVKLDEQDLRKALKEAAAFLAKEQVFAVKFDMKSDHVEVVARHSTQGLRHWKIKAFAPSGDTDGFQWLSVNPEFLLESMYAEGVTHLQGSTGDTAILVDGTSLIMPLRPQSNGIENDWHNKVTDKYRKLPKGEKPIPFPTESIKHAIPKEKLQHQEVMGRCEVCGCATPLGQKLCDECKGIKQQVDMAGERKEFTLRKAPTVSITLRKKRRFKDIQFDPVQDMFV